MQIPDIKGGGLGCDIIIVTMRTFRDVWYLAALSFIIAQTGVTGLISEAGADVGLNIIAGKPTNQCSTLAKATSGLAVDGNFSTTNCAQTGVMYNPWWAVDMGQNSYVYEVNITTALNQTLRDFVVGVTNLQPSVTTPSPGLYSICAEYRGPVANGSKIVLPCDDTLPGRYLVIYVPFINFSLALCEVTAYGILAPPGSNQTAPGVDSRLVTSGKGCRITQAGSDYSGTVDYTRSGLPCQSWSSNSYTSPLTTFPEGSASLVGSRCRNPLPASYYGGVWCLTDSSSIWELCSVPLCACTKWEIVVDTYSPMGRYFANHTSLTACLNACISLYSDGSVYCSGVDVSTATIGCWFHFNDSDLLSSAVQWTGITQYRRVENCSSNEIVIDNQALYGVATYQSSTRLVYTPERTVDGLIGCSTGSCSATNLGDQNPWWAIDLGESFQITTVVLSGVTYPGFESTNVIIAVTDYCPNTTTPYPTTYSICATFTESLGADQTIGFSCATTTPPGRYLVLQSPFTLGIIATSEVQIYVNQTATPTPAPTAAPASQVSDAYVIVGCFADSEFNRDLSYLACNSSSMTHQICVSLCANMSYLYSGLQDSSVCFCGNSFGLMGQGGECNSQCSGDTTLTCGGPLANTVIYNKLVCTEWIYRPLTFSLGAVRYPNYNSTTDCKNACINIFDGCVAIDVGKGLVECWVHYFNNSRLAHTISWVNVDQYLLTGCSVPQTETSSMSTQVTSSSSTTEATVLITDTTFLFETSEITSQSIDTSTFWTSDFNVLTDPASESTTLSTKIRVLTDSTTVSTNSPRASAFTTDFLSTDEEFSPNTKITLDVNDSITSLPTTDNDPSTNAVTDSTSLAYTTLFTGTSKAIGYEIISSMTASYETSSGLVTCNSRPPFVRNAHQVLSRDDRGTTAIYSCKLGFHFPDGTKVRSAFCDDSSVWQGQVPDCEPISCQLRYQLRKFRLDSNAVQVVNGSQVVLSWCSPGELFTDGTPDERIKCVVKGEMGYLHRAESDCAGFRCGAPPLLENAFVRLNQTSRTLTITCLTGYRLSDGSEETMMTCNNDSNWGTTKKCRPIYCEKLHHSSMFSLSTNDTIFGTVVVASCADGYMFHDRNLTKYIQCSINVRWNYTLPETCEAVFCADTPNIPFTTQSGLESRIANGLFPYGTAISYVCLDGRKFDDGQMKTDILCTGNGYWLQTVFSCDYNRCDPLPIAAFSTPNSTIAYAGSVVEYRCQSGYTRLAGATSTTICDGIQWNGVVSDCAPIHCPPLVDRHATLNTTENVYGSVVSIKCNPGYQVFDSFYLITSCTIAGIWSVKNATCKPVDCGKPPDLLNAELDIGGTTFGQNVSYSCLPGYWFQRDLYKTTITCQENRLWSPTSKYCIPVTCPPLVLRIVSLTNVTPSTVINVTCPKGHQFNLVRSTTIETVCDPSGNWIPVVPDCIDLEKPSAVTQTTDAQGSTYIGFIALSVISAIVIGLVLFDLRHLLTACKNSSKMNSAIKSKHNSELLKSNFGRGTARRII